MAAAHGWQGFQRTEQILNSPLPWNLKRLEALPCAARGYAADP